MVVILPRITGACEPYRELIPSSAAFTTPNIMDTCLFAVSHLYLSQGAGGEPAGCVAANLQAQTSYLLDNLAGACPLPSAFASVGWTCLDYVPPPSSSSGPTTLSAGAITGITIGVIVAVIALGFGGWFVWKHRLGTSKQPYEPLLKRAPGSSV
jgi:hypothetical protein